MQLLIVTTLATAIFAVASAARVPTEQAFFAKAATDVEATQFISYRAAAVRYIAANPGAPEGVLTASALAPYATTGVGIATGYSSYWKVSLAGPALPGLYVFSTSPPSNGSVVSNLSERYGQSFSMGTVIGTPSSPLLMSPLAPSATAALPASAGFTVGSLVMFGH